MLYDTNATQAIYTKWVTFYKAHRGTIIQPVVHLRRPDMQGWDGFLHVNPFSVGETTPLTPGASVSQSRFQECVPRAAGVLLELCDVDGLHIGFLYVSPHCLSLPDTVCVCQEVGVAMLFNPTDQQLSLTIALPLYYTGLTTSALVSVDGDALITMQLQRDYSIWIKMVMPPKSIHTVVINAPPA